MIERKVINIMGKVQKIIGSTCLACLLITGCFASTLSDNHVIDSTTITHPEMRKTSASEEVNLPNTLEPFCIDPLFDIETILEEHRYAFYTKSNSSHTPFAIDGFARTEGYNISWYKQNAAATLTKSDLSIKLSIPKQIITINGQEYPCVSWLNEENLLIVDNTDFFSALITYGNTSNDRTIFWENRSNIPQEHFYQEKGISGLGLIKVDDTVNVSKATLIEGKMLKDWIAHITKEDYYGDRIFYQFDADGIAGELVVESTNEEGTNFRIDWVWLEITSPDYYTDRFAHVGDSKDVVAKLYGMPKDFNADNWHVGSSTGEGKGTTFLFENGIVTAIKYES